MDEASFERLADDLPVEPQQAAFDLVKRLGKSPVALPTLQCMGHGLHESADDVTKIRETVDGSFVAIVPGLVIYVPGLYHGSALLGFLERRQSPADPHVAFELKLLRRFPHGRPTLTLYGVGDEPKTPRAERFKCNGVGGWMYYDLDRDTYMFLGFPPERWTRMNAWFDYWLPKE